jgi:predicted DNA-binding protein with PD1-like motif
MLPVMGQLKKTEVVRTTTPENDSKGLSASVPDSVAVSAKIDRVVIVRFKHQADILAGLEKQVKEQKIRNAVIMNGVGSVMSAHYHVVTNRSFPSKNTYLEDPTLSADIINVSGFVMNGKIHPHFTMASPDKAFGGHLEPGTKAFTFAIITLGVLPDDVDLGRFDDKNWR